MYQFAVIGAGQIGSRHLQALAKLDVDCKISVIDPSDASLETAEQRYRQLPVNPRVESIHFCNSIEQLPLQLDYVVLATSANVRLSVMQALLARCRVSALVLEKVLYTRIGDYAEATALLQSKSVKTWVNCTRRTYPSYIELRQLFAGERIRHFEVSGGEWGLGCNAIHFIDLLAFLSGDDHLSAVDVHGLDAGFIDSKRSSFLEFTGTCSGRMAKGAEFSLKALRGSTMKRLIEVRSDQSTAIIDEQAGSLLLWRETTGVWENRVFHSPFTSDAMTSIAASVLETGKTDLPAHDESCGLHLPFLQALLRHTGRDPLDVNSECAIT